MTNPQPLYFLVKTASSLDNVVNKNKLQKMDFHSVFSINSREMRQH